jgi:hypothetical protein
VLRAEQAALAELALPLHKQLVEPLGSQAKLLDKAQAALVE